MPPGLYMQAAGRWPHMFLTLSPTYMGIAQAAYDFTVRYLRGEWPGTPPVKRRMYPTKQIAVAQMRVMLVAGVLLCTGIGMFLGNRKDKRLAAQDDAQNR